MRWPTFDDRPCLIRVGPTHSLRFEGEDPTMRTLTYMIIATVKRTGSGDGRGGNARDRRRTRRAWRSS